MTLELLRTALSNSWSEETAYGPDASSWSASNRELGQCAVTALIVQDYFGGEIVRGYSKIYRTYHYWNIVSGKVIDLTFSQFSGSKSDIQFDKEIRPRALLLGRPDVKRRYLILRDRVDSFIENEKLLLRER